jgi:hypothetical protein
VRLGYITTPTSCDKLDGICTALLRTFWGWSEACTCAPKPAEAQGPPAKAAKSTRTFEGQEPLFFSTPNAALTSSPFIKTMRRNILYAAASLANGFVN